MTNAIFEARDLSRSFRVKGGHIQALTGVSLSCVPGKSIGIVGESGCGKTTLNRLLHLDRPTSGDLLFRGIPLDKLDTAGRHAYRWAVLPVFQNPYSSLSPRMRVRGIIAEPLLATGTGSRAEAHARVDEVLEQVGLSAAMADRVPSEFSGGQRQRIAIARALASRRELLLLDEPVSSQGISIQARVLNLLRNLQTDYGLATLFVGHDLATVRFICDEVVVIYMGRIAERGPAPKICTAPDHPYTRALLAAALPAEPDAHRDDPATIFDHVRGRLGEADIGYCQLEVNLTTHGQRVPQVRQTVCGKPEIADAPVGCGLGVVSFAGNHAMD